MIVHRISVEYLIESHSVNVSMTRMYSPYPSYLRRAFSDIVVGEEEDGEMNG
jgi:hypothetical protein